MVPILQYLIVFYDEMSTGYHTTRAGMQISKTPNINCTKVFFGIYFSVERRNDGTDNFRNERWHGFNLFTSCELPPRLIQFTSDSVRRFPFYPFSQKQVTRKT